MAYYGEAPKAIMDLNLTDEWDEFMHYLYLPVALPSFEGGGFGLPKPLGFLMPAVTRARTDAMRHDFDRFRDPYVYVTARRGFATPGNPLNRPGWHCDDFGGTDLNYIWTDNYPTQFLLSGEPLDISSDDRQSLEDMEKWAKRAKRMDGYDIELEERKPLRLRIVDGPTNKLIRLNPWVVHSTPEIKGKGGMRSFFKISVSNHRYNLKGNSHNYNLDYDWKMYDREEVRNQPSGGNSDYVIEKSLV